MKIQSRDYGRVKFKLLGTQQYVLDEIVDGISRGITTFVILKGRQLGITTLFIAIDFFYAFEHSGLLGTFIIHEEKALDKWRSNVDAVYDSLPAFVEVGGKKQRFKPSISKHNRNILLFSNGSSFSYLTAGVQESAKSGGLGRSQASNFVHGTETAFYGNEEDLKEFQSSVSALYPYRLQIHESTANGFNHFYDKYTDAKDSPTVKAIFVGWWRDERLQFHVDDPRFEFYGTDRLSRLELLRVRAVKERYGFDISMQQMAWYRWKLNDEFQSDQTKMDQEFPFTDDDAFQSSGEKYFTTPVLMDMLRQARPHRMQAYRYRLTRLWEETEVIGPLNNPRAELKIWEHASRFGYYSLACDPAHGSSDTADNSCVQVWRCFAECMVQVAEWTQRRASTYQTAWVIAHLAGFYGRKDCRVSIEINGPGKSVFAELEHVRERIKEFPNTPEHNEVIHCLDNMKYFYWSRIDTMTGDLAYHILTTEDIKRMLLSGFKDAIELGRMYPRSLALIDEMKTLENNDGSIAAAGGKNDDRVMTAAIAHETWRKWLRPLLRAEGMTRAKSLAIEATGGQQPVDRLMTNFLKRQNIRVPT